MNALRAVVVCVAVLAVGGALALLADVCRGGSAEAVTDPSAIGRFQIICGTVSAKDVYLLDTTSGHTWQMGVEAGTGARVWKPLPPRERRASAEVQKLSVGVTRP